MGVIRWFGRHLFLTILIIAVIFGYVYRDKLDQELGLRDLAKRYDIARYWPSWSPKPKGDAGKTAAATPQPAAPAPAPQPTAPQAAAPQPAPSPPHRLPRRPQRQHPHRPPAPAAQPAPQPAPAAAPTPAPAPAPAAAPAPAPAAAAPAPAPAQDNLRAEWMAARKAFWDGDLEAAETKYIDLMAANADEPDLAGELGNLYLRQGKRDEAAAMYLEAGRRILRGPNPVRANTVIAILMGLSPESADELRRDLFDHINQQTPAKGATGNVQ
ncbi:MAG: hypothetical protein H6907_14470 [Hyphomicrobiales bacterium]|nr:hypothetical protein [Hyphomicrobiales bacterium]